MYAFMYVYLYVYMHAGKLHICTQQKTCQKQKNQVKNRLNLRAKSDRFFKQYVECATIDLLKKQAKSIVFFCKFSFSIEKINLD